MSSNALQLDSKWVKIAVGGAVVAITCYLGKRLLFSPTVEHADSLVSDSSKKVLLMQHEREIMAMMPAVTTITRFRTSGASVKSFLRGRISEILVKNPWLTGRLKKNPTDGLHLCYEPDQCISDRIVDLHFQVVEDFDLPAQTDFESLVDSFAPLQVRKGGDCADKDEVLFRVSIVQVRGSDEVVLVFSVSHVLADGYTFYALQNMLDRNTPVTAMEVVRHSQYMPELRRLLGSIYVDWIHSPLVLFGLLGCAAFRGPMQVHMVRVDNDWIQAQKDEYLQRSGQSVSFVSTNDVLTAWHNKLSKTDVQLMSMNLRNRSPHFTDNMAGNYENSMMYNAPEDGGTPEAVRRSLSTVPYCNASNSVPGALKTLLWNGSITTNWCSFYKQIDLSDAATGVKCDYLSHMPICESNDLRVWREAMVIFKFDADTTGLLIATRALTADLLRKTRVGSVVTQL